MFFEFGASHSRTDAISAVFLNYSPRFRDPFDIHNELRLNHVGAKLNQEIGSPRENPGFAARVR